MTGRHPGLYAIAMLLGFGQVRPVEAYVLEHMIIEMSGIEKAGARVFSAP